MKKIPLFLLVILFLFSSCKNKKEQEQIIPPKGNLEGFFGIEWGTDPLTAEKILKEKGFRVLTSPIKADDKHFSASGEFAGFADCFLTLSFTDKGFYDADMSMKKFDRRLSIDTHKYNYIDLVDMLKEKYGEPNDTRDAEDSDYTASMWFFENDCSIRVSFVEGKTAGTFVSLDYSNDAVVHELYGESKSKNINDL